MMFRTLLYKLTRCQNENFLDRARNQERGEVYFVNPKSNVQIFGCSGNQSLVIEVAARLNLQPGRMVVGRYADGEVAIKAIDEVRGSDCYILQACIRIRENARQ